MNDNTNKVKMYDFIEINKENELAIYKKNILFIYYTNLKSEPESIYFIDDQNNCYHTTKEYIKKNIKNSSNYLVEIAESSFIYRKCLLGGDNVLYVYMEVADEFEKIANKKLELSDDYALNRTLIYQNWMQIAYEIIENIKNQTLFVENYNVDIIAEEEEIKNKIQSLSIEGKVLKNICCLSRVKGISQTRLCSIYNSEFLKRDENRKKRVFEDEIPLDYEVGRYIESEGPIMLVFEDGTCIQFAVPNYYCYYIGNKINDLRYKTDIDVERILKPIIGKKIIDVDIVLENEKFPKEQTEIILQKGVNSIVKFIKIKFEGDVQLIIDYSGGFYLSSDEYDDYRAISLKEIKEIHPDYSEWFPKRNEKELVDIYGYSKSSEDDSEEPEIEPSKEIVDLYAILGETDIKEGARQAIVIALAENKDATIELINFIADYYEENKELPKEQEIMKEFIRIIDEFETGAERIYPSENPDRLEDTIHKYMGRDLLAMNIMYELLKTIDNANAFQNWLIENDRKVEIEEAIPVILDIRIKQLDYKYNETIVVTNLYKEIIKFDCIKELKDIHLSFIIDYALNVNVEEEILNNLKEVKRNDIRWILFWMIMPHNDEDEEEENE